MTSTNGRDWHFHTPIASSGFAGPRLIVALGATRFLAVGMAGETETCEDGEAAVWLSDDLEAWSRLDAPSLGCGYMEHVTGSRGAFLASGTSTVDTFEPVAWSSPDGMTWQPRVNLSFAIAELATLPDGTFLAMGQGIWETADGLAWGRSAETGDYEVTAYAEGVAIGCRVDGDCRAWLAGR